MSDENDRLKSTETALAKERITRHLIEKGVDPTYAEGHVARHVGFSRTADGTQLVLKHGDWQGGLAHAEQCAAGLLPSIPDDYKAKNAGKPLKTAEDYADRFNEQRAAKPNPLASALTGRT